MTTDVRQPRGDVQDLVDWEFAKATGRRLVAGGPLVSPAEAAAAVADLRACAAQAAGPVAQTSRLQAPASAEPALVVDRPRWIDANVDSLQGMLGPVVSKLASSRKVTPGPVAAQIGGKITGGEAGALMSFLASKVLGQYDLAPEGTPRLLLVAPNILATERELGVDPHDFRLWVCLHEETHRVQFTAVPWLREHVVSSARTLTVDLVPDPERLAERLAEIARRLPEAMSAGGAGLTALLATPEQRDTIARLTAVMSLLEGHADVVMDDVGPRVVPTVAVIRARFEGRRAGLGSVDRLLRRLLGLEAKMRQYRDGALFVRTVTDRVGVDGLNAVWSSPQTLPLPAEIEQPLAWVRRVHG